MRLSFINNTPIRILFFIFIANFFYDDPSFYLYKRIIYSIIIYWVVFEIIRFYLKKNTTQIPVFQNIYLPILAIFVLFLLIVDLHNPNLNWITLLNNPFAMLSIGPIFLFFIVANTDDEQLDSLLKMFLTISVIFFLVFALPFFGKVKYYQGYICAYSFVPIFFISYIKKKYRWLAWGLIIMGVYFSQISGYRIIALRIILVFGLYIGFSICKNYPILKFLIIAAAIFCMYTFLANLEDTLYVFKDIIGVKDFDDDDTRGFLYEEVFNELKGAELIFGRGFLGTYFSEYFLMILTRYRDSSGDHYQRFTVEVGFLNLLLKGGFFWYILYIIPLLYTSMVGIFKHYKDPLIYFISIFILAELLLMFIENIPYFSFQFSMIFFLAGFAFHKMKKNEATYRNDLEYHNLSIKIDENNNY
jgi:hypothetical protein